MSENEAARLVGINHVALPVDDAEAAIEFYRENKASASELDPEGEADT
ncbi:VOC family protein [Halorubrum sp. RMP-47]|uniref:VOC family protein n=1 Tax=Halorubrum miltondacostae TaxID=3076378 RepID=A0ABD5M7U9_9EURY